MLFSKKTSLLPYSFKKYSWAMMLAGACFLYAYFQDIKPDWLSVKVFALASTYMENKYFEVVKTNLVDEIGILLFLAGLYILVFSDEKKQIPTDTENRTKAFLISGKITFITWIICYFFFFGYIILPISISMLPIFLLLYYLIFRRLRTQNL
jgi:hypothetical protein